MPKHRQDPSDYEKVTLSFRCLGRFHKIVHRAADSKGLSADQYMRKIVIDWACSDLGLDPPDDAELIAGPNQIAEAARVRGMSIKEFTGVAVREAAIRALAQSTPKTIGTRPVQDRGAPKPSESGTRRRAG